VAVASGAGALSSGSGKPFAWLIPPYPNSNAPATTTPLIDAIAPKGVDSATRSSGDLQNRSSMPTTPLPTHLARSGSYRLKRISAPKKPTRTPVSAQKSRTALYPATTASSGSSRGGALPSFQEPPAHVR
jgi:hypothetical protein